MPSQVKTVQEMPGTGRAFIGRVFGGAALAVAGVLTFFAACLLGLGVATLSIDGILVSLVYCVFCLPALPLFLLGRRVWRKATAPVESGR